MEKKEFLDVSREYFKSIGFQMLKKSKFYYESEELVLQVYMNHSNFSELYYIDYDFRLKKLHPEVQSIDYNVWDTIIAGRLQHVDYLLYDKDQYLENLKRFVQKYICPIMTNGIKYIKKIVKDRNALNTGIHFTPDVRTKILKL